MIAEKVVHGLYPGVSTVDLDNLAAEIASSMTTKHPDYGILAARIAISNLHKETKDVFSGEIFFKTTTTYAGIGFLCCSATLVLI